MDQAARLPVELEEQITKLLIFRILITHSPINPLPLSLPTALASKTVE